MSYTQLPVRTGTDVNAAADVNQLEANIEALKGGSGATPPTTNIEALALLAGMRVDVDGVTKTLKFKVITPLTIGTPADSGSSGTFVVAHGLTESKFIFVQCKLYSSGNSYNLNAVNANEFYTQCDTTNITVYLTAPYFNSAYVITIAYWE